MFGVREIHGLSSLVPSDVDLLSHISKAKAGLLLLVPPVGFPLLYLTPRATHSFNLSITLT